MYRGRPQFFFRTADVTGTCLLPEKVEMVMPGDNATMTIELYTPIPMGTIFLTTNYKLQIYI